MLPWDIYFLMVVGWVFLGRVVIFGVVFKMITPTVGATKPLLDPFVLRSMMVEASIVMLDSHLPSQLINGLTPQKMQESGQGFPCVSPQFHTAYVYTLIDTANTQESLIVLRY